MADDLIVMCSGAFADVLNRLWPLFEPDLGGSISVIRGPSIGDSPRALPVRLRAGEVSDVVIMFDDAIETLVNDGLILAGTKTRLASSGIGVAVRQGAPQWDISTPDALRQALFTAKSFAYSSSASGIYVSTKLIGKLGLPESVARRGRCVVGEPVGAVVARGDAELGFQQVSELVAVNGVALLGPLPRDLQQTTLLSAALPAAVRNASAARALIAHLTSERAIPLLVEAGLDPAKSAALNKRSLGPDSGSDRKSSPQPT